ncbi:MAG: hypothetical protein R3E76_05890 [Planctomycetota bacterium]
MNSLAQSCSGIHDPGNELATAWTGSSTEAQGMAAIYDLSEGFVKGVADSATSRFFNDNNWTNEPCYYISVDNGPFDNNWMFTWSGQTPLEVTLGPDASGNYTTAIVLGVDTTSSVPGSGYKTLAVKSLSGANLADYTGTGKWYYIDGERRPREAVQSGQWDVAAYGSSTSTTFTLDPYASLTDEMVGWTLQPNVNAQTPFASQCDRSGTLLPQLCPSLP